MKWTIAQFFEDNSGLLTVLGIFMLFYKSSNFGNPAIASFMWLFSSVIILIILGIMVFRTYDPNYSLWVRLMLIPFFGVFLCFMLQFILDLFTKENQYSLYLVENLFMKGILLATIISIILTIVVFLILYVLSKRKK